MADIIELGSAYAMSPVLAGFLGAGVLVLVVVVLVLLWSFCQRRYLRVTGRYKLHGDRYCDAEDPPYKFIHMLKGISIYPESLSSSKRIVRGIRRAERSERDGERSCPAGGATGRGMVLVDAENNILDIPGQLQMSHLVPPSGTAPAHSQARLERALPVRADYCCLDSSSASSSQTSSKTASPFTPASSEPEPEPNLGSLSLTVDYNFPKKALVVTIVGARGLPAIDEQAGSSDPYVKMTILPEKKHRVKTRVLRKTLDPIFDETFTFYGVAYSSLPELTLHFLVLSFDRFARDDVIGEAVVPLKGVDPSTGRVHLSQQITKRNMQVRMAALQAFQGFSTLYNTEHVTHTEIRWKQQLVEFSWRLGIILSGSDGLTLLLGRQDVKVQPPPIPQQILDPMLETAATCSEGTGSF
ncbi:synaptotagmin-11b isoform X2 [Girardinichthys multiradiatus]|uniref:synaptotagmin-11b isoform X2 n=1 Tax=Girardinichthys multiradiatus TaxID=208333 RepID=UPI001FAB5477|nr:synaptotagmin-11b isoform X2 [Girardinichthys multiradiatus]